MSFALSKILWFIVRPGNLLALLACIFAVWSACRNRSRLAWATAIIVSLTLIIGLVPIGQWLARPLEDRYARPATMPAQVDGIILLGGAQVSTVSADRGVLAINDAAERYIEAVALARQYPNAKLLFTGGSGRLFPGVANERLVNEIYADLVDLDPARIVYEDRSRNTYENALFSKDLIAPKPDDTWILVTSARHMPRSMGVFGEVGWNVIAWPVDYRTATRPEWPARIAVSDKLVEFDEAVKEWAGLLAYWLMGRTDALFPAPQS